MTDEMFKYMNDSFEEMGIPYEFGNWSQELQFPFAVGSYTEIESINEDGLDSSIFILTVTSKNKYYELEKIKNTVKRYFPIEGRTAILDNGSGVAVSYSTAYEVPTGDSDLKRMQINLNTKEWKGD